MKLILLTTLIILTSTFPCFAQTEKTIEQAQIFIDDAKYDQAEELLEFLIFSGQPSAGLMLYDLHQKGHITVKDAEDVKRISLKNIDKQANNGNSTAALNLGNYYLFGRYVDRDYKQAHLYFLKADALGNANASYRLGMSYLEGLYNPIDHDMAIYYLKRADKRGHPSAANSLTDIK